MDKPRNTQIQSKKPVLCLFLVVCLFITVDSAFYFFPLFQYWTYYIHLLLFIVATVILIYALKQPQPKEEKVEQTPADAIKAKAEHEIRALGHKLQVMNNLNQQREQELIKAKQQLALSQKYNVVGQLAINLTKEFNKIFNALIGSAYLLRKKVKKNKKALDKAANIIQQSTQGLTVSKQLLRFELEHNQALEAKDINEVAQEVKSVIENDLDKKIKFNLQLSDKDLFAKITSAKLFQVLMNLVINAKESIKEQGAITLVTKYFLDEDQKEWVKLSVLDTGEGIHQEMLNHIFEPYFTTKKYRDAAGLGLSTIVTIVQECRGKIEVNSVPGKGSRFDVLLPYAIEQAKVKQKLANQDNPSLLKEKKFLLVNTHEEDSKAVESYLTSLGASVIVVQSSAQAIKMVQTHQHFDIVLIDIDLDEMDGVELSQVLEDLFDHMNVIYVCDVEEDDITHSILEHELTTFVMKPIQKEQLLRQILLTLNLAL